MPFLRIALIAVPVLLTLSPAFGAAQLSRTCLGQRVTVRGTDGDDVIRSSRLRSGDVVALGDGKDHLTIERLHNVIVCGGRDGDALIVGKDPGKGIVLNGEEGDDAVFSDLADNSISHERLRLIGGPGRDYVSGGTADDMIKGDSGADDLSGNGGEDSLEAGSGEDFVVGGHSPDVLFGGPGDDKLYGGRKERSPGAGDEADGGLGQDSCRARFRHNCERH